MIAALTDLGWSRSAAAGRSVTAEGEPIPWFTYAAIHWLEPRLRSSDRVFEFGSGQSTLWFAERTRQVTSVEHHRAWAAELSARKVANVTVMPVADPGPGSVAPAHHPYLASLAGEPDGSFEIVVVDGRVRVSCLEVAAPKVTDEGLIVLDNSDRPQYRQGISALHTAGFGRLDFLGPVPGSGRLSITSVFVRDPARWLDPDVELPSVGYL